MKNRRYIWTLLLPVLFFWGCNSNSVDPTIPGGTDNGTPITGTWEGFTIPNRTEAVEYSTFKDKNKVLRVSPSPRYAGTGVMNYSLNDYIGQKVDITVSMDVWLDEPAIVAWMLNQFPVAGDTEEPYGKDEWHTITGTITITVTANNSLYLSNLLDSAAYIANLTIDIVPSAVRVTGIALEKPALSLLLTDTAQKLNYTITPPDAANRNVSWTSGAPAVVSVSDDGTVKAEAAGEAVITVQAQDGGHSASINVYVSATPVPATGIKLDKSELTLTMFSKEKLTYMMEPAGAYNRNVTWTSGAPAVVSVSADGTVKALSYTGGATGTVSSEATGSATITVKSEDGGFEDSITVTTTMASRTDMMTLAPLKDQFKDHFMMGNVFSPGDLPEPWRIDPRLTYHYNILTHENNMKPSYMSTAVRGVYNEANMETAMRMIDTARAAGIKVQGHTLLWHSQNAGWMNQMRTDGTTALEASVYMDEYITEVVSYYKGKIYAWDVLNEAFPDSFSNTNADWRNEIRTGASGNPWYMTIGSDFVFQGFRAARLADPGAILYYNDFNLDGAGKATMVRNMVRDVNERWLSDPEYDGRLLIEGIGMQSHHNTNVQASAIKASLDLFKPLGVVVSITELDVLSGGYANNQTYPPPQNSAKLRAAELYGQYFDVFLDYADIIERVTFWGFADGLSWRNNGLPLPFDGPTRQQRNSPVLAKPAYYKMIESLEKKDAQ